MIEQINDIPPDLFRRYYNQTEEQLIEIKERRHAHTKTLERLEALAAFMLSIGFQPANGELWRGFYRQTYPGKFKQHMSFYLAKNVFEFACTNGSCMYNLTKSTPNLVIINEMTLTGINREYKILKTLWNKAVDKKRDYPRIHSIIELQVDKRRRCVYDRDGFVQYNRKSKCQLK